MAWESVRGLALRRRGNVYFQAGMKLIPIKGRVECSEHTGMMPALRGKGDSGVWPPVSCTSSNLQQLGDTVEAEV